MGRHSSLFVPATYWKTASPILFPENIAVSFASIRMGPTSVLNLSYGRLNWCMLAD